MYEHLRYTADDTHLYTVCAAKFDIYIFIYDVLKLVMRTNFGHICAVRNYTIVVEPKHSELQQSFPLHRLRRTIRNCA